MAEDLSGFGNFMLYIFGLFIAVAAIILLIALAVFFVIFFTKISDVCSVLYKKIKTRWAPRAKRGVEYLQGQMQAWSSFYICLIAFIQTVGLLLFIYLVVGSLSLWGLVAALLVYPFFVCALAISLLMRLPVLRACWADPSVKILVFGSQLISLYVAKGTANVWLNDLWGIGIANIPMAHTAAVGFVMLLMISIPLLLVALVFEFLLVSGAGFASGHAKRGRGGIKCTIFKWGGVDETVNIRYLTEDFYRRVGMSVVMGTTIFACVLAQYSASALFVTRLSNKFLAAVVFELDAVSGAQCKILNADDRADSKNKDPNVKVIYLSTTQEKAIIVRRAEDLYSPMVLKEFNSSKEIKNYLALGEVVACYGVRPSD
ncbi:hypothetical protein ACOTF6_05425 [Achromobacter xylosoxidans]